MTSLELGFWSIGAVLLLIAARVPIGVVLGGIAVLGIAQLRGIDVALGLIKSTPFEFSAHWNQFYLIGINLMPPQKGVVSTRFRNVPPVMVWWFAYPNPAPTNPSQYSTPA